MTRIQAVASAQSTSLENFKPRCLNDLIRLGRDFDGGYVVNRRAVSATSYLFTFGVNEDWSFEADFLKQNPTARVLCFDHSVSRKVFQGKALDTLNDVFSAQFLLLVLSLNARAVRRKLAVLKHAWKLYRRFGSFFSQDGVSFYQKELSSDADERSVTLAQVFQMIPAGALSDNSVFLKMDIEQSEHRVLHDLHRFRRYINAMVVEFHDLDILWTNFTAIMNQLREDFEIVHLHGNNFDGLISGTTTPKCLEVTLLKKTFIGAMDPVAGVSYPIPGLDRPNDPSRQDYALFSGRS